MEPTTVTSAYAGVVEQQGIFAPIRKSRNFTALWLGQTLSQFGDAVLWVTLPLAVFHTSKSTFQLGLIMGLFMLPQVLLLPFTGILADRISRTRAMMATDVIRCLLVISLAVIYVAGLTDIRLLGGFVLVYGAMEAVFTPAYSGARQQVFTPDIRNAAISLTQISIQIARLLGPALGGVIVGFASPAAGLGLDALMLLASVVSLTFLHIPAPSKKSSTQHGMRDYFNELLGGYHELRKHPWLWITILAFAFLSIASTGLTTILVPWVVKIHLGLSDSAYGLVSSAAGLGAVFAAFIYGRRSIWRHRAYIAYGGLVVNALAILGLAFVHTTVMLMVLMAIASAGGMLFGVVWEGSMQELISPEAYGRAASLDYFGSWVLLPVGNVLTGWLSSQIGGIHTVWVASAFMLLVTVVTMAVPLVRRFD
ncbi:MFS transporter [Alicyclobacillus dauci]|uniref:MFS transporter n=1 Tax=Alicyclobacillus dauci TaxID=1475485 RepID=A0ABY6Z3T8_9BACL|nr:MFS transporter [Alicyclobacillus dauci]WAH37549.1 MFS transporter [Alicyclobacillus dauci]